MDRPDKMSIGSLLTWEQPGPLDDSLDRARGRYLVRMAGQLSAVLGELAGLGHEERAAALRARLSDLPADALFSVLLAPETHRRLTLPLRGGTGLLAFLEGAAIAEACRAGLRPPPSRGVWSADGACYFKASATGRGGGDRGAAPVIAVRTVVDTGSPHARLSERNDVSARRGRPDGLLDGDDLATALTKLHEAVRAIERTSIAAHMLVSRALRVLVLTRHPRYEDVFQSVSTRAVVGRAVIVNAHRPQATVARIADALVHEAIHAFLYELEQAGRWVRKTSRKREIVSPWTGNTLTLDSYVHACFVWFALSRFWGLPEAGLAFSGPEARYLGERARRGFASGTVEETIDRNSANLLQGIPDQMRWVVANVA